MTKNEALKLALEALELALRFHGVTLLSDPPKDAWKYHGVEANANKAITAIKQALAQPEKIACTHEWIDDTRTKPAWRCVKCGEEYKKEKNT
jgi:hypothetical protein